jgi:hypothetical protein
VTPEGAVARLAEIVSAGGEFSEDSVYAAMAQAGLPDSVADRAYKFTQTAWARAFLGNMGVRFPPDYLCFNGQGDLIESGPLDQEPYFLAASQLVPQYVKSPGFSRLVRMSADVSAVNNALHAGSKPENLAMGPAAFFMETATPAAVARARQVITERAKAARPAPASDPHKGKPAGKPWWRFW